MFLSYFFIETYDFYLSIFSNRYVYFIKSVFSMLNLYKLSTTFFFYLFSSLSGDRDCELFFTYFIFSWIFFYFIIVLISLIVYVNEELDSSLLELFFYTFCLLYLIYYIPDIFIHYFSSFNYTLSFKSNFTIFFLLFIIEKSSHFIKSLLISVRLNTNFISGHMLITILIVFLEFTITLFSSFSILILILFICVYFLELFISYIQLYVFSFLLILYLKDFSS